MRFQFTLTGTENAERVLDSLGRAAVPTGHRELYRSAERVMERSKSEYCPIDTGALRASGSVQAEIHGNEIEVRMGYGGGSAPYAVFVHEINKNYKNGKTWKYLQIPLQEAVEDIKSGLADSYNAMIRNGG